MMRFLILYALILFPTSSWAEANMQKTLLEDVVSTLHHPNVLRAKFTQSKKLRVLKQPLLSNGRMIYSARRGIVWIVEKPYEVKRLITPSGDIKNIPDALSNDQTSQPLSTPFTQEISKIFLSTFAGDLLILLENFEIVNIDLKKNSSQKWTVRLKPKKTLARFIRSLSLRGGTFIAHIRIVEINGDATSIKFNDFTPKPERLKKGERAYFSN